MTKQATVKVLGQKFTVIFSNYSDEYFECQTPAELKAAAKTAILGLLNEVTESQNENALVRIESR